MDQRGAKHIFPVALLIALSLTPALASGAQVLIDFGNSGTGGFITPSDGMGRTWNNIHQANDGNNVSFSLITAANMASGYTLTMTNPPGVTNPIGFNGDNQNGTTAPTGSAASLGYPISATRDSLYGNSGAVFNGAVVERVRLTLSGLLASELYDLTFYASRLGVSDNRQTEYHVVAGNEDTSLLLNVANNVGDVVSLSNLTADTNGQIVIDIDAGPANTNANGFFYLGVMQLDSALAPVAEPVPEPATIGVWALLGAALVGFSYVRKRSAR